ncbi:LytTR family DNA-binding domain-containing protein [Sphingomonas canadensis]|uniref:LytTR family DNA-binding domain-containing protein n=1 Tax=Sphingomonas canadensis TaxID=1219257 RepID=A0ABW3H0F2_9SPHN|nr:LytTR family DNA-binding domain-containing protein [Sphingomonas canadensis]MCW3835160.1 LytTR family transcriptional regulator DNA-binding domain-containing protein [Sphingomonas canadensis]
MPDARRLIIDVAAMAAIALVVALLGPFGTFAMPFAVRLIYWGALAYAGYFLYLPAMVAASRLAQRLDLPEPASWAAACLAATLPMSAVVWCVNRLGRAPRWPGLEEAFDLYLHALVLGAAVCAIFWFVHPRRRPAMPGPADPAPPPPEEAAPADAPFLDRLPPHLGRDLLALEMEDHYVRAHTALGSALILMRMRDAVAGLDGIEGMQVHRSWWVARAALVRTRRDGRNLRLELSNGVEAPVARGTVEELRGAGWITG